MYSTVWFILVKLGGFHTMINGLDATGYIMAGFGFRRASEGNLCDKHYSTHHGWPLTTLHSGPAFSSLQPPITSLPQPPAPWFSHLRQRRGNLHICMKARWPKNHNVTDENLGLFTQAMSLFDDLSTRRIPPLQLSNTSDSWAAWFQYHLHSFHCMLPYLAAFGPNFYTKSVTLHLETLYNFEGKHPEMYTTYLEHGHTVRRSDRLWGWLSLSVCTGHGMISIIKSAGGLSHWKGVDEFQRAISLLSTYITVTMCKCKNWQGWIWNNQMNTIMHVCQGQRWFAESHQLHRATQSLAACAFLSKYPAHYY